MFAVDETIEEDTVTQHKATDNINIWRTKSRLKLIDNKSVRVHFININKRIYAIIIRAIICALEFIETSFIQGDFQTPTAAEEIRRLEQRNEERFHNHSNTAIQLLDYSETVSRIKNKKPYKKIKAEKISFMYNLVIITALIVNQQNVEIKKIPNAEE